MSPSFRQIDPGRLQIREGGGCLGLFGFPFLAAGVFLLLLALGVVPIGNAEQVSGFGWFMVLAMGVAFTVVGGVLTLGRTWMTIDAGQRLIVDQKGLLIPMRSATHRVGDYTAVAIQLEKGDSDSYPVVLTARAGSNLRLCQSSSYAEAWANAVRIAEHLSLDVEDATTDHTTRVSARDATVPLRDRLRREELETARRPDAARSDVFDEGNGVRIVIPPTQHNPLLLLVLLVPAFGIAVFLPSALRFFRETNTPDLVAWFFLGFVVLLFGVLPASSALTTSLRMRKGRTIVTVSPEGIRVEDRGIWRTRTTATIPAAEIIEVDFSTRESMQRWATHTGAERLRAAGRRGAPAAAMGPRTERILTAISRVGWGQGIIVKSRQGLTQFGQGLDDEEICYLHALIRLALVGQHRRW